jgi:hypothetical protein
MNRQVVLAHPRSGSNSVVEIPNRHPEVSILNEPFNEQFASWDHRNVDYCARLRAGEDFDAVVDELLVDFTGLKAQSYQLDDDRLYRLMTRPDVSVIALRRRNVLQTAVSQLVAGQTGVWKTWDVAEPLADHYRNLSSRSRRSRRSHPLDHPRGGSDRGGRGPCRSSPGASRDLRRPVLGANACPRAEARRAVGVPRSDAEM